MHRPVPGDDREPERPGYRWIGNIPRVLLSCGRFELVLSRKDAPAYYAAQHDILVEGLRAFRGTLGTDMFAIYERE